MYAVLLARGNHSHPQVRPTLKVFIQQRPLRSQIEFGPQRKPAARMEARDITAHHLELDRRDVVSEYPSDIGLGSSVIPANTPSIAGTVPTTSD